MSLEDILGNLPELTRPVMIVAFEGWNDAGEAATDAIEHLQTVWDARWIGDIDPEDYYDFQVNRPNATFDEDGRREISWPTTSVSVCRLEAIGRDVVLVQGLEPNVRWRGFAGEILAIMRDADIELVVTLGAMLAETPHTRPIPVNGSASTPDLNARYGFEPSSYEGPTGILGIISAMCSRADIPVVQLWAAIPHYFSNPPSPKGTVALLSALENVLDVAIAVGDLSQEAQVWETEVDALAADSEEVTSYVHELEKAHDESAPTATGEELAQEFERYLRRREQG